MEHQSKCSTTTSISQNRVRLNETKVSPGMIVVNTNSKLTKWCPCGLCVEDGTDSFTYC